MDLKGRKLCSIGQIQTWPTILWPLCPPFQNNRFQRFGGDGVNFDGLPIMSKNSFSKPINSINSFFSYRMFSKLSFNVIQSKNQIPNWYLDLYGGLICLMLFNQRVKCIRHITKKFDDYITEQLVCFYLDLHTYIVIKNTCVQIQWDHCHFGWNVKGNLSLAI